MSENGRKERRRDEIASAKEIADIAGGLSGFGGILYTWFVAFDAIGFALSLVGLVMFTISRLLRLLELRDEKQDKDSDDS